MLLILFAVPLAAGCEALLLPVVWLGVEAWFPVVGSAVCDGVLLELFPLFDDTLALELLLFVELLLELLFEALLLLELAFVSLVFALLSLAFLSTFSVLVFLSAGFLGVLEQAVNPNSEIATVDNNKNFSPINHYFLSLFSF
ncbi:hypothetical protein EQU06_06715 [Lactobacillus sanfranciscensis]|uniref:hypothetical protein n=1 Tax=Fructilactobacillus sanfranciscensis TaxID=1625 RepID=UPI00117C5C97|nr:hypothetical protein [Fructilactobacillus sanfranciscensis]NDR76494.1 hypothetical protein [Fructilactobacillus sanfranciscensis]NDR97108.1 hypothetical protein [Fructilactobacillus sanfranciscensis]NDS05023.1 hypothetical protein [Fructilactobacillus sanfranciscensis]